MTKAGTAFENGQPVATVGFDYRAVDGEPDADQPSDRAEQLRHLLEWLTRPAAVKFFGPTFQRKIVALCWVVNPSFLRPSSWVNSKLRLNFLAGEPAVVV